MIMQEQSKLEWKARRGMLELDLLFTHYINNVYPQASTAKKQCFEQLLDYPDQQLFDCFFKNIPIETQELQELVDEIRQAAQNVDKH